MKKFFWYSAMCLGLLPALTGRAQPQPQTPASDSPSVFETTAGRIRVVRIASGLVSAYSMVFVPEGDLLVIERPGRLRIIRKGILEPQPVWKLPPEPLDEKDGEGADRLHFLAIHPQFAQNRMVYFSYTKFSERGNTLAVAR